MLYNIRKKERKENVSNIEKKDIIIKSNCDNLPISATMFVPEGDIKGIFQVSHGMAEHKERYYPFMEFLTEKRIYNSDT